MGYVCIASIGDIYPVRGGYPSCAMGSVFRFQVSLGASFDTRSDLVSVISIPSSITRVITGSEPAGSSSGITTRHSMISDSPGDNEDGDEQLMTILDLVANL